MQLRIRGDTRNAKRCRITLAEPTIKGNFINDKRRVRTFRKGQTLDAWWWNDAYYTNIEELEQSFIFFECEIALIEESLWKD